MKRIKIFLLTSMVILFATFTHANTVNMAPIISYILSDMASATPQEIAIDKIKAYANNQASPIPTVQDYVDAGVVGVTTENLDDINDVIANLTPEDVDTVEEIQALVDIVNNTAPVADAGLDREIGRYSKAYLDGSQSYDYDGDLLSYSWTLEKPSGSTAVLSDATLVDPTFIADLNGEYIATLVVNDGRTDSFSVSITIIATTQYWKIDGHNIVPTYEKQIADVPAVPEI